MTPEERRAVAWLRTPAAIRERCGGLLALAREDRLEHFRLRPERVAVVAERVEAVSRAAYPDLEIPYHSRWRHFDAARLADLTGRLEGASPEERGRARFDLVVTSVLLDAGAGPDWAYTCPRTGQRVGRSEGLALASFDMFLAGAFSSDPGRPLRSDAAALARLSPADLAAGFQAGPDNPLVGLEGRTGLLVRLGEVMQADPARFGAEVARVGGLFDVLAGQAEAGRIEAAAVLGLVLDALGGIWPGRVSLAGANLGDVWRHPAAGGEGPGAGLVPFHKLSQWLTYSLLEPLEAAGIEVTALDALTGLPEYRNGGLLLDLGLLEAKHEGVTGQAHAPGDVVIVEWRALTVALLDEVAAAVRARLDLSAEALPLAQVLQGGTWTAGRLAAKERRADGGPPIRIASDGTVF